jgi:hypothetical protein
LHLNGGVRISAGRHEGRRYETGQNFFVRHLRSSEL